MLVDSTVLTLVNTGEIEPGHFARTGKACALNDHGRRVFLEAWERRLDALVTHPVFGYRVSYRKVLGIQARLLSRHLQGELAELPEFRTR